MKRQNSKILFQKLSPQALVLFRHQLAQELTVHSRQEEWRERRVIEITPLNQESFSKAISFQYKIAPNIILKVLKQLMSHPQLDVDDMKRIETSLMWPDDLYGQRVTITLPIDRFPKNLRVGFSLKNARGNTIPLLLRSDVSQIMDSHLAHHIQTYLQEEYLPEKRDRVEKFIRKNYLMFRALSACFPKTIYISCLNSKISKTVRPCTSDFNGEKKRYETLFNYRIPLNKGRLSLDSHQLDREWKRTFTIILKFRKWLGSRRVFFPEGIRYLGINPLLWIREYFFDGEDEFSELEDESSRVKAMERFLLDSRLYIRSLWKVLIPLNSNATKKFFQMYTEELNHYMGFCEIQMVIGERIIVKMHEVLKAKKSWTKYGIFRLKQGCPISLGTEQSWHLELVSPSFIELEIIEGGTYLQILNGYGLRGLKSCSPYNSLDENIFHLTSTFHDLLLRRKKVFLNAFSIMADFTGERSHYYKSVLGREFNEILRRETRGIERYSQNPNRFRLWVNYKIHAPAMLGNIFSFVAVLFCFSTLVIFVSKPEILMNIEINGKTSSDVGRKEFLALIAVTVTVLIATMAIPERQRMTAPLIRGIRKLTVAMGVGVYLILAGGAIVLIQEDICLSQPSFCSWIVQGVGGLRRTIIFLIVSVLHLVLRFIDLLF